MSDDDLSAPPVELPEELLTTEDVARRFGVSIGRVRALAQDGMPPDYRLGRRLLYRSTTVEQFAALRAVAAAPPLPARPALPRVPGSRWRLKSCLRCGKPFSPKGPASKWDDACRAAVMEERAVAKEAAR